MDLYRCSVCGKLMFQLKNDSGTDTICCGQKMEKVPCNENETMLGETHIPTMEKRGDDIIVQVGSKLHPCMKEHYIENIILETDDGFIVKKLSPNDKPEVKFGNCKKCKVKGVYCYCNRHGLYKYTCK